MLYCMRPHEYFIYYNIHIHVGTASAGWGGACNVLIQSESKYAPCCPFLSLPNSTLIIYNINIEECSL